MCSLLATLMHRQCTGRRLGWQDLLLAALSKGSHFCPLFDLGPDGGTTPALPKKDALSSRFTVRPPDTQLLCPTMFSAASVISDRWGIPRSANGSGSPDRCAKEQPCRLDMRKAHAIANEEDDVFGRFLTFGHGVRITLAGTLLQRK